jgi:uncharacterized membrane protein
MKIALACALVIASVTTVSAQTNIWGGSTGSGLYGTGSNPNSHYVSPHTNSNGTYVGGHYRTNPNNTQLDNYGTRGNLNPYTGTYGTRNGRY